jgi:hypothetical protein
MLTAVEPKGAVWLWPVPSVMLPHELLSDVRVPLNAIFLLAQPSDDGVLLSEVYHISDKLQLRRFGTWSENSGLRCTSWRYLHNQRTDLQGTVIKVSAIEVL